MCPTISVNLEPIYGLYNMWRRPASQRKYTHERFRLWSRLRSIEYYSPFQQKACLVCKEECRVANDSCCINIMRISNYKWKSTSRITSVQMRLCTWKTAIYKSWFTNLQLQSCNVSMFRIQSTNIAFTEYKTTFFKFRFTSLKWHNTRTFTEQQTTNIDLKICNYMVAMLEFWPHWLSIFGNPDSLMMP